MEMKWNPIVNGDLSEVPRYEDALFTIIDNLTGDSYVICDEIDPTYARNDIAVFRNGALGRTEKVIAWMELPEPFEPGKCSVCKHREQGVDNFGDHWAVCHLLDNVPFSQIISLKGCPLEEEVD